MNIRLFLYIAGALFIGYILSHIFDDNSQYHNTIQRLHDQRRVLEAKNDSLVIYNDLLQEQVDIYSNEVINSEVKFDSLRSYQKREHKYYESQKNSIVHINADSVDMLLTRLAEKYINQAQ